jgi:transcriptional regulator with PAS, ATPase and Fis domain
MPPLRKRVKDIPGLLMHILNGFGYDQFPLDIALIEILCQYSWPGNIRELRNMVERAVLLAQGKPLSVDHFPGLQICKEQVLERVIPNNWNLETIEKDHIVKALRHFGDKGDASKALGISLSSLYRKMESYKGPMPVS